MICQIGLCYTKRILHNDTHYLISPGISDLRISESHTSETSARIRFLGENYTTENLVELDRDGVVRDKRYGLKNSHPDVFCKIGVFENYTKFTEKRLCRGFFLAKL